MAAERIISADSHVREPVDLWSKTLGAKLGERVPRPVAAHAGKRGQFFYMGSRVGKLGGALGKPVSELSADERLIHESGFIPEERLRFQRKAGIEAEVLYPSLMAQIMTVEDPTVAQSCAAVYNDWISDFCAADRKRLIGVAAIPTQDAAWARRELDRTLRNGLRGAMVNVVPPEGALPYRNAVWDNLWAGCQDAGIPVILHIVTGRAIDPILYYHTEQEYAAAPFATLEVWNEITSPLANDFIFGGIFDRFPKLRVICAEYEVSWIPYFMYRIDQMQSDFTPMLSLPKIARRASDYMRDRVWHGMIDDPFAFDAFKHIGTSQVLWGSDFPHVRSIGFDTAGTLSSLFGSLAAPEKQKVIGGTIAELMNI